MSAPRFTLIGILSVMSIAMAPAAAQTFRVACLEYSGHTGQKNSEVKMQVLYEGLNIALSAQAKAGTPVDLIVTGETPTLMGSEETMNEMAQVIPGPRTDKLGAIAARYKVWLIADLLESDPTGPRPAVYNSLVVFDRTGKIAAKYRKVRLPKEEVDHSIQPGSQSMVIDTEFGRMGLITCWEVQFPDYVADLMKQKPHFVVHPTAGDFRELLPYIARQYGVYFASASWSGPSIVVDPKGQILAEQRYDGGKPAEMKLAVADIPRARSASSQPSPSARAESQKR